MHQVVVIVDPKRAEALQRMDHHDLVVSQIARAARQMGLTLAPQHPGSTDPVLRTYFVVEAPDAAAAELAARSLRACLGVEAAYSKPPDELP